MTTVVFKFELRPVLHLLFVSIALPPLSPHSVPLKTFHNTTPPDPPLFSTRVAGRKLESIPPSPPSLPWEFVLLSILGQFCRKGQKNREKAGEGGRRKGAGLPSG